jgi:hypothetical protein
MPKQVKKLSVDELTKYAELLSTQEQLDLIAIIENIVEAKRVASKLEFDLITNGKKK